MVQAEEESERESSDDDRHRGELKWPGAIRVQDGHHEEQPKRVMWPGALRLCYESSQAEKEGIETVANGCHEASVEVQPNPSRVSVQRAT
ncbi:hypothetical protein MRB53_000763 [Persea americana]|uniref:Uncharacterized protein n=1 Tax=Persea americana TaxID=3435 RepID=A0ACC2MPU2_PERAE|nr:hypothetical protein MRB53_000763 [Persea americana]